MGQRSWWEPDAGDDNTKCIKWQSRHLERPKQPSYRSTLASQGWLSQLITVSPGGLAAWQDAIALHGSQVSAFWSGEEEIRQVVARYLHQEDGLRPWKRPGR